MSNHGVAIRLSEPRPVRRATLARALVDFGVQVRAGARAGVNGGPATPVVGEVAIGGRPKGLFGSKHRSHTTAWVVFTDVVKTTILNQPLPAAVQLMSDLIDETRLLPGASAGRLRALTNATQVMSRVEGAITGATIYDRADATAQTAQNAMQDVDGGALVAVLQDLVAAYLELRNVTPLSVTHDTDTAGGHGEGTARGALIEEEDDDEPAADVRDADADQLQQAQQGQARLDPLAARAHLWKLLDFDAVRYLMKVQPPVLPAYTTAPGNKPNETPNDRLAAVVAQHLLTVRRAYPRVFNDAGMDSDDSLRGMLGGKLDEQTTGGATVLAAIRGELAGARPVPAVAASAGVNVPAAAPRGTAQIVLGDDDGTPFVSELRLGTRPLGILGTVEGAHLTAFGLVAEGLKAVVVGQPLDQVGLHVAQLIDNARRLATAYRAPDLRGQAGQLANAADQHANAVFDQLMQVRADHPAYVGLLQDYIVAYLWLRNSLPLAATSEGGVPAGKAEGHMLRLLREAEQGYNGNGPRPDDAAVLDALWNLLDSSALNYVVESVSYTAAPGIRDRAQDREKQKRAGDIISTHINTAAIAFPMCVARTGMRTRQVIGAFLRGELPRVNMRPSSQANQDLAFAVHHTAAAHIAFYVFTGAFPPPRVQPAADPGVGRPRRNSQPPKRPLDDNFEGEDDFDRQEIEMVEEEEGIVRHANKKVRRR